MAEPESLPDFRCNGMPDVPYSSYCRTCWYPIYTLWFTSEDHGGACMEGQTDPLKCSEARARARNEVEVQKLRDAGLWPARKRRAAEVPHG